VYRIHRAVHWASLDAYIRSLSPEAWFLKGIGQTVTGSGVSQWDDISGNGRHLLQGTDSARPALQADGSVLFNGTSHYLKCSAFTLNQPTCVLMVVNVKAWTANDRLFDGNASDSVTALQNTSTPKISLNAGVALGPITPPLNELHVHKYVANGASSSIGYDKNASTAGNAGTNNMGGFTLGARGVGDVPSNIQVYETVIFPIAPSTAQLDRLVAGLMARHGVAG